MAQQYFAKLGDYPLLRVAYLKSGVLTVVVAKLGALPTLPDFAPPPPGSPPVPMPGPDSFTAQTLDTTVTGTETPATLDQYESTGGFLKQLPPPGAFQPRDPKDDPFLQQQTQRGVTVPGVDVPAGVKVEMYWIGRMRRPGLDILSTGGGGIVVDPMLFVQIRAYQALVLKSGTTFPAVRIPYHTDAGWRIAKFRLVNPSWWSTLEGKFTPTLPPNFTVGGGQAPPPIANGLPFLPPPPDVIGAITVQAGDLTFTTETPGPGVTTPEQYEKTLPDGNDP